MMRLRSTHRTLIAVFLITTTLNINQASANSHSSHSWSEACLKAESVLEEGDLIFLDIPSILFRKVAEGSGSWTSYVGMALKSGVE